METDKVISAAYVNVSTISFLQFEIESLLVRSFQSDDFDVSSKLLVASNISICRRVENPN